MQSEKPKQQVATGEMRPRGELTTKVLRAKHNKPLYRFFNFLRSIFK